ncbi:hypothetical protein [Nocardioides sp. 503]|uniref:hypothetical protein n=1 Tax=Nocardioides sp. 503 TaxID=2508326 RepID=UPI00107068B2|nr:hypothetical protein [Nocardioides sp. 503]
MPRPGDDQGSAASAARAPARRRLLVLALALGGLVVTVLMTSAVGSAQGVYVGKVEVVVHLPRTLAVPNPLATSNQEAVRFAALVAEVATHGEEVPRVTNQSLTLADQGLRHETMISLVNLGGQWANDFSRPFIRVEAVDETPQGVSRRLQDGIARVTRALERLQDEAGVPTPTRATASSVPAEPQVRYAPTHRERAMAATALLGLVLTAVVCRRGTRSLDARRGRHQASSDSEGSAPSRALVTTTPAAPHRPGQASWGQGDPHGI